MLKKTLAVLKNAYDGWTRHKAPRMGAALSYYTAFSVGPLVVIAIAAAGLFLGQDAASGRIFQELEGALGTDAASGVQAVVRAASHRGTSIVAAIVGIVSLVIGATGAFGELHDAFNTIWGVKAKQDQGWVVFLRDRFLSLAMVVSTGFLLLVSLLVTAALTVVGKWLSTHLPGGDLAWQVANFVISLAVVTGIFTLLFKFVPDVKMPWRAPLIAGAVTSVLFTIGKLGLALYVAQTRVASTYGAAGSVVVLLIWVFYAAQIVYFGAELCRALAVETDDVVKPARSAARVGEASRHMRTA